MFSSVNWAIMLYVGESMRNPEVENRLWNDLQSKECCKWIARNLYDNEALLTTNVKVHGHKNIGQKIYFHMYGHWILRVVKIWNSLKMFHRKTFFLFQCHWAADGAAATVRQQSRVVNISQVATAPLVSHCITRWQPHSPKA